MKWCDVMCAHLIVPARLLAFPVLTSTMSSVTGDGLFSADPRVQALLETNTCGSALQNPTKKVKGKKPTKVPREIPPIKSTPGDLMI